MSPSSIILMLGFHDVAAAIVPVNPPPYHHPSVTKKHTHFAIACSSNKIHADTPALCLVFVCCGWLGFHAGVPGRVLERGRRRYRRENDVLHRFLGTSGQRRAARVSWRCILDNPKRERGYRREARGKAQRVRADIKLAEAYSSKTLASLPTASS